MGVFRTWMEENVIAPIHERYDALIEKIDALGDKITVPIAKKFDELKEAVGAIKIEFPAIEGVDTLLAPLTDAITAISTIPDRFTEGVGTVKEWFAEKITEALISTIDASFSDVAASFKSFSKSPELDVENILAQLNLSSEDIKSLPIGHKMMLYIALVPSVFGLSSAISSGEVEKMRQKYAALNPVWKPAYEYIYSMWHRKIITTKVKDVWLRTYGYDAETIKALDAVSYFYPSPQDLITWQAREVFEEDAIEKYGLMDEYGLLDLESFYKASMTDDQIANYWKAHWQHPAWTAIIEMAHRGLLTGTGDLPETPKTREEWLARDKTAQEEVYEWFRLVEVPPYWRDKMFATMYKPLTRVDVRRMWDLRVVDRQTVYNTYRNLGYNDEGAEQMTLFTIVYELANDLKARYSKGWLGIDEVRTLITETGMPGERVEEWVQMVVSAGKGERLAKEKDLTKAEIVKGVKKEVITMDEGKELLLDLGYDEWEAAFILAIEIEASTGSPHTFLEFKQLALLSKKAHGSNCSILPEKLLELEKDYLANKDDADAALRYREALIKFKEECKNGNKETI